MGDNLELGLVPRCIQRPIAIKMSMFPPAKPPKTALGFRRILSPTAGIRVSPLCLGAMSIGEQWGGEYGQARSGSKNTDQVFCRANRQDHQG